jgi:DNA polymerase-3 subunit beta
MKITITKKDILRAATIAANAAAKKSSIPALTSVKIEAGDGLRISGTDLYTGASVLSVCSVADKGCVTAPAKQFVDAVRGLADGNVTLHADSAGRLELSSGRGRQRLAYGSADDYPAIPAPTGDAVSVPADAFVRAIAGAAHFAGTDENVGHIYGVHIEIGNGRVRAVTTDGKAFAVCDVPVDVDGSVSMLVPFRSLSDLRRTLADAESSSVGVTVDSVAGMMFVETSAVTFSAKLTGTTFLAGYERALDVKSTRRVLVARDAFTDATKRVTCAVADMAQAIELTAADGSLSIATKSASGDAHDSVDADFAGVSGNVCVRASYLAAALGAITADSIAIEFSSPLDPVVLAPADDRSHVQVIAAMRP